MSSVFILHDQSNQRVVEYICKRFEKLSYTCSTGQRSRNVKHRLDDQIFEAVKSCKVIIPIVNQHTIRASQFSLEIGALLTLTRLNPSILLLPLVVGDIRIPLSIKHLNPIRLSNVSEDWLDKVTKQLQASVQSHIDKQDISPRIFISHPHKDQRLVEALVDVLNTTFEIQKNDLRCTSVNPYKLSVGESTPDRLKHELLNAEVIIGIVTPHTKSSNYVLFELGGAWIQNKVIFPLLGCGGSIEDIPDPLANRTALFLDQTSECYRLIDDLENVTSLNRRRSVSAEVSDCVEQLVLIASGP